MKKKEYTQEEIDRIVSSELRKQQAELAKESEYDSPDYKQAYEKEKAAFEATKQKEAMKDVLKDEAIPHNKWEELLDQAEKYGVDNEEAFLDFTRFLQRHADLGGAARLEPAGLPGTTKPRSKVAEGLSKFFS